MSWDRPDATPARRRRRSTHRQTRRSAPASREKEPLLPSTEALVAAYVCRGHTMSRTSACILPTRSPPSPWAITGSPDRHARHSPGWEWLDEYSRPTSRSSAFPELPPRQTQPRRLRRRTGSHRFQDRAPHSGPRRAEMPAPLRRPVRPPAARAKWMHLLKDVPAQKNLVPGIGPRSLYPASGNASHESCRV